jgi:hypothetical protein
MKLLLVLWKLLDKIVTNLKLILKIVNVVYKYI